MKFAMDTTPGPKICDVCNQQIVSVASFVAEGRRLCIECAPSPDPAPPVAYDQTAWTRTIALDASNLLAVAFGGHPSEESTRRVLEGIRDNLTRILEKP